MSDFWRIVLSALALFIAVLIARRIIRQVRRIRENKTSVRRAMNKWLLEPSGDCGVEDDGTRTWYPLPGREP